jgi:hypothetical protein
MRCISKKSANLLDLLSLNLTEIHHSKCNSQSFWHLRCFCSISATRQFALGFECFQNATIAARGFGSRERREEIHEAR